MLVGGLLNTEWIAGIVVVPTAAVSLEDSQLTKHPPADKCMSNESV